MGAGERLGGDHGDGRGEGFVDPGWIALPEGAFASWRAGATDAARLASALRDAGSATEVWSAEAPVDDVPAARLALPGDGEGWVGAVGALLQTWRPQAEESERRRTMAWVPAVEITWLGGGPGEPRGEGDPADVRIALPADLWFPRVPRPLVGETRGGEPAAALRAALAARHTPRLNAFLAAVRGAADAWHPEPISEGRGAAYAPQVTADGIRLP